MKAMLFAAGLGTRLKPFTDNHPKALAVVNGKTLLEYNIQYLQHFGITDIVINTHHFADQIETALRENDNYGSNVTISHERHTALETGGGLKHAADFFKNEQAFVVMNVDVLTSLDLEKMIEAHKKTDALATLAVMQRNSSRQLLFDDFQLLCGWANNITGEQRIAREVLTMHPLAFSGVQVLSPAILDMPFHGKFSLIDVYLHFAKTHVIKGFNHTGDVFIDVGKPETLEKAAELFNVDLLKG
jgi:N-acetyl-alpha-D-muramate 1-phosphate uridylyltransferase